jgi:hypothetical protein
VRTEAVLAALSGLARGRDGVFAGQDAVALGVKSKQLTSLIAAHVIQRTLPGVYRLSSAASTPEQSLRAALMWGEPRQWPRDDPPRSSIASRA